MLRFLFAETHRLGLMEMETALLGTQGQAHRLLNGKAAPLRIADDALAGAGRLRLAILDGKNQIGRAGQFAIDRGRYFPATRQLVKMYILDADLEGQPRRLIAEIQFAAGRDGTAGRLAMHIVELDNLVGDDRLAVRLRGVQVDRRHLHMRIARRNLHTVIHVGLVAGRVHVEPYLCRRGSLDVNFIPHRQRHEGDRFQFLHRHSHRIGVQDDGAFAGGGIEIAVRFPIAPERIDHDAAEGHAVFAGHDVGVDAADNHGPAMFLMEGQLAAFDVQTRQLCRFPLLPRRHLGEQMAVRVEVQRDARPLQLNGIGRLIAQQTEGGEIGCDILDAQPGFVLFAVGVDLDAAHAAVADQADVRGLHLDAAAEHVLQMLGHLPRGTCGGQITAKNE